MTDPSIEKQFSRAAASYDQAAAVQRKVIAQLTERLPFAGNIYRILEIGCGTGELTQVLADQYPQAHIDAIDISPTMIEQAQKKVLSEKVCWVCEDYLEFKPIQAYDLICSANTLHWLHPLDVTLLRMNQQVSPNGRVLAALMLHDTFRELHELRATLFPGKSVEQRLPTPDSVQAVLPSGWEINEATWSEPLVDTLQFFKSLRQLGVTGGAVSRKRLNHAETLRLVRTFDAESVTWQVGYLSKG